MAMKKVLFIIVIVLIVILIAIYDIFA